MTNDRSHSISLQELTEHVPYLRRYGRALAGNQPDGDGVAAATLSSVLAAPDLLDPRLNPKVALFNIFQSLWAKAPSGDGQVEKDPMAQAAQKHLSHLDNQPRNALLLKGLEQFSVNEIAQILQIGTSDVQNLLQAAYSGMADTVAGRVLIIEDDSFIANEIETIVTDMGHLVTGNAATKESAVSLAMEDEPDLILADVVLADQSSGIEATREILTTYENKPVIFVTGHPEKLLTGQTEEPTYLIPKPYMHEQVRTAVNQALFFTNRGDI